MRVLITGATGFIGRALGAELVKSGYELVALVRARVDFPFPVDQRDWREPGELRDISAVVHLAGEPVANGRWTKKQKEKILSSRVESTRALGAILGKVKGSRPQVLVSASGIGFYGDRGDEWLDETSRIGSGFLAEVCVHWEEAALSLGLPRTVMLCTGLVLGREGGALSKMLPPFRLGLGGRLGDGRQWMSWIHLHDMAKLYQFVLEEKKIKGPVNAVAPNPVTNSEFTATLGRVLNRPAILPVPASALKLALGEMSQMLLTGQRVKETLSTKGFKFRYTSLETALRDCVS